jgi:hypothetical protein
MRTARSARAGVALGATLKNIRSDLCAPQEALELE